MLSIQAPKMCKDNHSIWAPFKVNMHFKNYEKLKSTHLLSIATYHTCTFTLGQDRFTTWLVSEKWSYYWCPQRQPKSKPFFDKSGRPLKIVIFVFPACSLKMKFLPCQLYNVWQDSVPSLKDIHVKVRFFVLFCLFCSSSHLFLCSRCALSPLLSGSCWSSKVFSSVEQSPLKLALPSPFFCQSSLRWQTTCPCERSAFPTEPTNTQQSIRDFTRIQKSFREYNYHFVTKVQTEISVHHMVIYLYGIR